ncbi:fibronectin type III domain-containing protein [Flavobacteriaceae bacterium]|nr:fibronectin type III domain-containing protein [Flavobacteriaceae bacterium]
MKKSIIMKNLKSLCFLMLVISVITGCTEDNIIDAPVFPPPAVEGLTAIAGNALVTLNWDNGNTALFTNYSLTYSPSDGEPISIANNETSIIVNGLLNGTEYTFTLVAQNTVQLTTQSSEPISVVVTPFEPNLSGPELSSFSFLSASNPDMALEAEDRIDLAGTIDLENNTVAFSEDNVSAYVYRDALVATFAVPVGAVVTVNGEEQTSGVTIQDFSSPVQYEITENGITRIFTVTVNKNQFATIPDDAFRAFLVAEGLPFNADNQLEINSIMVTEYKLESKINIDNVGISNVKGIEFFVGVKEIDAERNSFPSINVSRNTGLKNILVGLNANINNIEIGELTQLEIIYINDAILLTETVMQPIIDANLGLKRFYAQGIGTGLVSLNVDNLVAMERLRLNESTAMASAASINTLLGNNPPVASDLGNLRIFNDVDGIQCASYDPTTYECN